MEDSFYTALENGNSKAVIQYLENGSSLTEKNSFGETPLFVAARNGNTDIAAILLLKGADPMEPDTFGELPVHAAAAYGKTDTAALLASQGGALDSKGGFGLTPYQEAVKNGYTDFPKNCEARIPFMEAVFSSLKDHKNDLPFCLHLFEYQYFPAAERQEQESWISYVSRSSREKLEAWLDLKDKTFPAEISAPKTPDPIVLTQEEWETNGDFENRVKKAQEDRGKVIERLQGEFRLQVEKRNKEVASLKELQQVRVSEIASYRSDFAKFGMEGLLSDVTFEKAALDKNNGDLYFNNVSINATDTIGSFVLKDSKKEVRQAAFQHPDEFSLEVEPFADQAGNFGIHCINVTYGGKTYTADPTEKTAKKGTPLYASIDSKADFIALQEQNLSFIDKNAIGKKIDLKGNITYTGIDDSLNSRISKLRAVPEDVHKWAFVIGAEKYINTDSIAYADRSAELFTLAAEKALGVPEGHIIALYDTEATSGNIKSKIKKLFEEGISKGDTVFFYYDGHGVPNPLQENSPYLLPTDMDISCLTDEPFYNLKNLYSYFLQSKAGKVIAFMDSCFTGKTDGTSVFKGTAAPRLSPGAIDIPSDGKVAVMAAGTGTQFSNAWPDKGQRLFSYYVIDELANGTDSVENLFTKVHDSVSKTSRQIFGGKLSYQDPTLQGNENLEF
jgi:hypothetical protein